MYPSFVILGQPIYIFGLTIVICFFLFFWMFKKLAGRLGYNHQLVSQSIFWYFFSTFFFSRLFYVISMWKDMQHIDSVFRFFITSNFHFSLLGAIFGFLSILFIHVRVLKKNLSKYMDGVVLSFLFILILGFIGGFLGGQVSGRHTSFGIEVLYEYKSLSMITGEVFPLGLVYSAVFFIIFSLLYISSLYIKVRGIIGYVGLGLFSAVTFGLESFTGKRDVFKTFMDINLAQIGSVFLLMLSIYGLIKIMRMGKKGGNTILGKAHD